MAFPAKVFVTQESDHDGSKYHLVHRKLNDTVETGESKLVGVYKLVDWIKVTGQARIIVRR